MLKCLTPQVQVWFEFSIIAEAYDSPLTARCPISVSTCRTGSENRSQQWHQGVRNQRVATNGEVYIPRKIGHRARSDGMLQELRQIKEHEAEFVRQAIQIIPLRGVQIGHIPAQGAVFRISH